MSNLFLFDVDSTLINEEVIELIAAHAGVEERVKEITDRAMAGLIDFEQSLNERVSLLSGLDSSILNQIKDQITITEGAVDLIATLHAQGDKVAVVSGGFVEVISDLMEELQVQDFKANRFEIANGHLTGRVNGAIVDRKAKADYLFELKRKYSPIKTFAIGDGANDIDMVNSADVGIAFCAKAALNEIADVVILKRDLREVLNYL
jgi:phosphoserine phosphatase